MYRALYRKWRPQRFEDVVGQRGIVTALRNQIATGRVGHAYLFTGVRGTGKTTCAKIFAKAVNCLHPKDGDPCGECEICKGIDNGSILDVVEMDAASNNGVDDIRDLRDETAYTPSFITICFSAILMYYIERSAQPEVFENIGDGIWWAIITFATVGYGDIYPITPLGKLLGCIICLVGVAMVAIPTGIISSSFINIVQKKEKKQGEDCNNESDKQ